MKKQLDIEDAIKSHPKGKPLDASGREIPDPVPMAPPVGYVRQPSMVENIRNMVKSELLRREVEAAGYESFEEADDFEMEDEDMPGEPRTVYEKVFDPPLTKEADRASNDPVRVKQTGDEDGDAEGDTERGQGSVDKRSKGVREKSGDDESKGDVTRDKERDRK